MRLVLPRASCLQPVCVTNAQESTTEQSVARKVTNILVSWGGGGGEQYNFVTRFPSFVSNCTPRWEHNTHALVQYPALPAPAPGPLT
jgi:hypothetical protein